MKLKAEVHPADTYFGVIEYLKKNVEFCNHPNYCDECHEGHSILIDGKWYHTAMILLHLLEREVERQGMIENQQGSRHVRKV